MYIKCVVVKFSLIGFIKFTLDSRKDNVSLHMGLYRNLYNLNLDSPYSSHAQHQPRQEERGRGARVG